MGSPGAAFIRRLRGGFLTTVVCVLAPQAGLPGALAPSAPHQAPPAQVVGPPSSQTTSVDVVVLDTRGQPVLSLQPGDFSLTVDGTARQVVSAQYVFRGPGARAAAAQLAASGGSVRPEAETSRTILIVVDEASLIRGDERQVRSIVSRLLDRLGSTDVVAVVPLPGRGARIALTNDREIPLEILSQIAGRAAPAGLAAAPALLPPEPSNPLAEGKKGVEGDARPRDETRDPRAAAASREAALSGSGSQSSPGVPDTVTGVRQLIDGLRSLPGPKVLVLISSGLPDDDGSPAIDQAAATAAAARATVHVLFRRVAGWRRPCQAPLDATTERYTGHLGAG